MTSYLLPWRIEMYNGKAYLRDRAGAMLAEFTLGSSADAELAALAANEHEQLRAEVARLAAERDAAIAETETFRETLVDNEAYGLEVIRERDEARADAARLTAELAAARDGIAELWNLCEILPHNQDCDISGTGYCDCNRGIFNSTIQNIMDANHMGEG